MLIVKICIAAIIFTLASARVGARLGLVDKPDARKLHVGHVPLTGGIGIFLTVLFGTLVLGIEPYTYPMLGIACALLVVSVYDDFRNISPRIRLLVQFGAGLLLAGYGGVAIVNVGNLLALGAIPLLWLSIPLTALSVAGLSNAYNMIDGIDGLAGTTLALPLVILYLLALQVGHPMSDALLLLLIPLGVFLVFNLGGSTGFLPKIFLGDAGSVGLGFLVTASLVFFSQGEGAVIQPVTALWLVTVPLMDMLATMLRRYRHGRSLVAADRSHLHHTLMARGLSPGATLLLMSGYASLCASLGVLLEAIPAYLSLLIYFLLFCGHCLFVSRLGTPRV